ncbi:rhomboid family intramembrane serine protease [Desulforhopalus sp. IMCC35007]|uniref:rhomboid family intramembrane serine protease n=1 Tax=Desulforhopalus sp. IMCC35007 TaxID=2569543 RepID=UPI0010ADBFBE|nr:rhomboid family intramembrane serine protease [Desulforhopalus sp. IMCC35007]TKB06531.1 rhomboid family intramembrane serine protease [Desulforhopalus sp. IMCC35007]
MASSHVRSSLLCPNCRKLISGSIDSCPFCGLKNPSSPLKNNPFTRSIGDSDQLVTILISLNVVMFILSVVLIPGKTGFNFSPFSFLSPSSQSLFILGSTGSIPIFQYDRWWTLLTANFLHGGILHLVFNMLAVRQLAPLVIQEFGPYRTISLYILGGIGGFAISAFAGVRLTIGASAALCSLIGALLYYGKARGGVYGQNIFSQIGGWALGIAAFGFLVPGINNWGHGGGILFGVILALLLGYKEKRRENFTHKTIAMTCVTLTVLALLWSCFNAVLFLFVAR